VRRAYLFGILIAVLLFLAISALLARVFSIDGAERSAILALVQTEAKGDSSVIVAHLHDCAQDAACRARAEANAAALKHRGSVSILELNPSAGFSLTSTMGTARVAWNVGGSRPIVQCVGVRRAGNALSGFRVELLSISPKLAGDATCP
jgi:hypothetical protein